VAHVQREISNYGPEDGFSETVKALSRVFYYSPPAERSNGWKSQAVGGLLPDAVAKSLTDVAWYDTRDINVPEPLHSKPH
jgi:hypothetical protein